MDPVFQVEKSVRMRGLFIGAQTAVPTLQEHMELFSYSEFNTLGSNKETPGLQFDMPHSSVTGNFCSAIIHGVREAKHSFLYEMTKQYGAANKEKVRIN